MRLRRRPDARLRGHGGRLMCPAPRAPARAARRSAGRVRRTCTVSGVCAPAPLTGGMKALASRIETDAHKSPAERRARPSSPADSRSLSSPCRRSGRGLIERRKATQCPFLTSNCSCRARILENRIVKKLGPGSVLSQGHPGPYICNIT